MSMAVGKGYKKTDVGVIPEDWEVKQIVDLKPFVTSGSRGWAAFYSDMGAPFIRITNLSRGSIYLNLEDLRLVNIPNDASEGTRTQLQDRDVLISITADIGIIGYVSSEVPKPAYINQHIALVRFDSLNADPKFVSYFLASEKPQKLFRALTDAGAKAGMSLITVQKIPLALPPTKAEQEAIAEALSDADALIESLEQLIAKKRHLKQGAMQELLTGKRRLPGFAKVTIGHKQTEVGVIPEDWELVRLGCYADITKLAGFEYSNYFNSYKDSGDVVVIRGTNITRNALDLSDVKTIPKSTSNKLPRSKLKKGDLVFAYVGTIGPVFLISEDDKYHLGPNTARITCKDGLNPHFLFCYFLSDLIKKEIVERISTGAQPSLSMTKIRAFPILKPTKAEQEAIAEVLSDMDTEIDALEAKLAKACQLKQGMMHNLLTGKIRLI